MSKNGFFRLFPRFATSFPLLLAALNLPADVFHEIEIRTIPALPGKHSHGYRGLGFLVANHAAKSKSMTLTLQCNGRFNFHVTKMTKSFKIPAGGVVKVFLHQPPLDLNHPHLDLLVDGYFKRDVHGVHIKTSLIDRWNTKPSILVTKTMYGDISKMFDKLNRKHNELEYARTDIPLNEWGMDWLGLSRYDGIILSERDLRDASHSVKLALDSYVKLGRNHSPFPVVAFAFGRRTASWLP